MTRLELLDPGLILDGVVEGASHRHSGTRRVSRVPLVCWIDAIYGLKMDAPGADALVTTELAYGIGVWMGRRRFLQGVAEICAERAVEWEWNIQRRGVFRMVVLTLSGAGSAVALASHEVEGWALKFQMPIQID